jgi:acyl-CoA thioester hydrolase
VCYQRGVVSQVYTVEAVVRHDELDRFGRMHAAAYLRHLAHAAVLASTAAGYDPDWYARAGAMWFVRRSTMEIERPARFAEPLTIRTWVEDFRRVRSHRRYEVLGADGSRRLTALTDWVYVDAVTQRPRRVPAEMEAALGSAASAGSEREPWSAPPPPAAPALARHRVAMHEVDAIGHVNNAAYLDFIGQATLDALGGAGWPLDRCVEHGGVPILVRADVEYLDGARYGEELVVATWFTLDGATFDGHHAVLRPGTERPLVRAATRWRFGDPATAEPCPVPDDLAPRLSAG